MRRNGCHGASSPMPSRRTGTAAEPLPCIASNSRSVFFSFRFSPLPRPFPPVRASGCPAVRMGGSYFTPCGIDNDAVDQIVERDAAVVSKVASFRASSREGAHPLILLSTGLTVLIIDGSYRFRSDIYYLSTGRNSLVL
jgi:hypothetical protein